VLDVSCNVPTYIAVHCLALKMATPSFSRQENKRSDAEIFLSGKHLGNKFHLLFDARPGSTKSALDK